MIVDNSVPQQRLVLTGNHEFKELLLRRLTECGWRDQVRLLVRDFIMRNDCSKVTLNMLIANITPVARALVPETVKKEMLREIKARLRTQTDQ